MTEEINENPFTASAIDLTTLAFGTLKLGIGLVLVGILIRLWLRVTSVKDACASLKPDATASAHVIQDAGSASTQRANLNFAGDELVVTDDVGNNATIITIEDDRAYEGAWAAGTDYGDGAFVLHSGSLWATEAGAAAGETPILPGDWPDPQIGANDVEDATPIYIEND